MIAVTGCPRSGTSLMMDVMRTALGESRILGAQWPGERVAKDEHRQACADYAAMKTAPQQGEQKQATREMNPNGFWECGYTVAGIQYADPPPHVDAVCKIVSQGLARSNPEYIDKVVVMSRHPWAVANSQRDLRVQFPFATGARKGDLGDITTQNYIQVTRALATWLVRHNKHVLVVDFDDLVADPVSEIERLAAFIGEGDWATAAGRIEPRLRRSPPDKQNDHPSWGPSLGVYEALGAGDWPAVAGLAAAYMDTQTPRSRMFCTRFGGNVTGGMCRECQADPAVAMRLCAAAEDRGVDWRGEPCMWECGMDPDRDSYTPVTIQQSVEANHWAAHAKGLGDTMAKAFKAVGIKPCRRCKSWAAKLNRLLPYSK